MGGDVWDRAMKMAACQFRRAAIILFGGIGLSEGGGGELEAAGKAVVGVEQGCYCLER